MNVSRSRTDKWLVVVTNKGQGSALTVWLLSVSSGQIYQICVCSIDCLYIYVCVYIYVGAHRMNIDCLVMFTRGSW